MMSKKHLIITFDGNSQTCLTQRNTALGQIVFFWFDLYLFNQTLLYKSLY